MPYVPPTFEASIPDAVKAGVVEETQVIVVGAGPIGLATALDLSLHGIDVVLLDRTTQLSDGSRAVCFAKRPLEILDRLGIGERMLEKGVSWNVGRVFFGDDPEPVYSFDLLPVKDQKFPGMVNLQQYYNEQYNIEALAKRDNVELRWGNEVVDVETGADHVVATVATDAGDYRLKGQWLIACDGCHSPIRKMLDMGFEGQTFHDNFLIADVKFKTDRPTERYFWFDPPFNRGQSALLHKQPDDVWRLDFQVGWDIDREEIVKPENVTPRIKAMLGDDIEFEYEWISVYTFNCRQVDTMVKGRVIFAGDSAHLVSPFGARGANTGFQDSDNLVWKLDLVMKGLAGDKLLASYDQERMWAAKINILNSTRSTDFITPKSPISHIFRDAVLQLARDYPFARSFVNSGRLSTPVPYPDSPLNTPDEDDWEGGVPPGSNAMDAPVRKAGPKASEDGWLLPELGWGFKALYFLVGEGLSDADRKALKALKEGPVPVETILIASGDGDQDFTTLEDVKGLAFKRYDAAAGSVYLFRPDQYVAGRWRAFDAAKVAAAVQRAIGA